MTGGQDGDRELTRGQVGRIRTAACNPAPSTTPPPKPCSTRDAISRVPPGARPMPMHAAPNRNSPTVSAARASRPGTNLVPNTSTTITPADALSMKMPM